jgi:hypothetical protein
MSALNFKTGGGGGTSIKQQDSASLSGHHHSDVKLSSFVQLLEKLLTTGKSSLKLQMVEAFISQFY